MTDPDPSLESEQQEAVADSGLDEEQRALILELKWGNTLLLLLVSLLTLGVYPVCYIWRQTRIANHYLDSSERMSWILVCLIALLTPLMLLAFPAAAWNDQDLAALAELASNASTILAVIWSLKARRRMNSFLEAKAGDPTWFSWLPSFFFPGLYFNIKVNSIARTIAAPPASQPNPPTIKQQ